LSGSVNDIALGMNEIDAVINRTKDISKENRQNIDVLVRELSKFRVHVPT
jgi:methyl-accepting chemotaxis protein